MTLIVDNQCREVTPDLHQLLHDAQAAKVEGSVNISLVSIPGMYLRLTSDLYMQIRQSLTQLSLICICKSLIDLRYIQGILTSKTLPVA